MIRDRTRAGFALAACLWAVAAAGLLVAVTAAEARDEIGAARNRASEAAAMWTATGCLERTLASASDALWQDGYTPHVTATAWNALDSVLAPRIAPGCHVTVTPAGLAPDVNSLPEDRLRRLLRYAGVPDARVDSLADAVLDWLDADDAPRPAGAEAAWYAAQGRATPRNGPIRSIRELRLVRGFEDLVGVRPLLGVEPARILWTRANRSVLAALPGMSDEAMAVLDARGRTSLESLALLGTLPEMPEAAREGFARAVPDLIMNTTSTPEAWIIEGLATVGEPPIAVGVETRVTLGDRRLLEQARVIRR